MISVREIIVVEGRYDKNTLKQLVNATVIELGGFRVFKDDKLRGLLRRLARERGIIILTDSDGAGFVIRNHLRGILPAECVKHAYIPDRYGKERRKKHAGMEGKLGVEGMPPDILLKALKQAGAEISGEAYCSPLTKTDFYELKLSGQKDSSFIRNRLKAELDLPEKLSGKGLFELLTLMYSRQELEHLLDVAIRGE